MTSSADIYNQGPIDHRAVRLTKPSVKNSLSLQVHIKSSVLILFDDFVFGTNDTALRTKR